MATMVIVWDQRLRQVVGGPFLNSTQATDYAKRLRAKNPEAPGKAHLLDNVNVTVPQLKHISCRGCREWFDAATSSCPHCQWERPGFNSWLANAHINNVFMERAEAAKPHNEFERERKRYKADLDRISRDL